MNADLDNCLDDRIFANKRTSGSTAQMAIDDGRDQSHTKKKGTGSWGKSGFGVQYSDERVPAIGWGVSVEYERGAFLAALDSQSAS